MLFVCSDKVSFRKPSQDQHFKVQRMLNLSLGMHIKIPVATCSILKGENMFEVFIKSISVLPSIPCSKWYMFTYCWRPSTTFYLPTINSLLIIIITTIILFFTS